MKKYTFKGVERVASGSVDSAGKPKQTTKPAKRSYARAIGGGGKKMGRAPRRSSR